MSAWPVDVYRTKDAIILHHYRLASRQKKLPAYFVVIFGFYLLMAFVFAFINIFVSLFIICVLISPLVADHFLKTDSLTVTIDRDCVRTDRVNLFGFHFVKQTPREENIDVSLESGRNFNMRITNGNHVTDFRVHSLTQAKWIYEQITLFFKEVPRCVTDNTANAKSKPLRKDADSGLNVIAHGNRRGLPLHKISTSFEKMSLKQGRLQVLCDKCQQPIPESYFFAENMIAGCPDCRTFFEILASADRKPTPWMRAKVVRKGSTLRITQTLFGWNPWLWGTALFAIGVVVGFGYGLNRIYRSSIAPLSPEQVQKLLYGTETFPWGVFHFFLVLLLIAAGLILYVLCMFFHRYRLEITPETCVFEQYGMFRKKTLTLPRTALRKYVSPPNKSQRPGELIWRNGVIELEEGAKLYGIINNYLLTVPPSTSLPFEKEDMSVDEAVLTCEDDEIVEVRYLDTSSGKRLDFEQIVRDTAKTESENVIPLHFPRIALNSIGRFHFEKTPTLFRFEVKRADSTENVVGAGIAFAISSFLVLFFCFAALRAIFSGEFNAVGILVLLSGCVFLITLFSTSLVPLFEQYRGLYAEWYLEIDGEKLELVRRYRNWEDRQSVPRTEILAAKYPCFRRFKIFSRLPWILMPGRVSLVLRNHGTLDLPGFSSELAIERALYCELNTFLQKDSDTKY